MTFLLIPLLFLSDGSEVARRDSADAHFARMDYEHAAAEYESGLVASPDSAQLLWRLARLYVCEGDVAQADAKEEKYRAAERFASRCIRADSMIAQGHTWRAAALGNIAMFEGSRAKVRLCNNIKVELDRAISLDSTDDVAYSVMGSFYLALGNVSWIERSLAALFLGSLPSGGYPEAETALRRAVSLAPSVIRHRFELAMVYVAEDRTKEALESFRLTMKLPTLVASDTMRTRRALKWIEKLEE